MNAHELARGLVLAEFYKAAIGLGFVVGIFVLAFVAIAARDWWDGCKKRDGRDDAHTGGGW